jgi:hypothetical protein
LRDYLILKPNIYAKQPHNRTTAQPHNRTTALSYFLILLTIVITTTFTSCKKDNTTPVSVESNQDYNNYSLSGDEARTKIATLNAEFNNQNSKTRDGSNIPLAEAVWNI